MSDSARWCEVCKAYGNHHTDRHDETTEVPITAFKDRDGRHSIPADRYRRSKDLFE